MSNLKIQLGENEHELRPTAKAAANISQRFGGLINAQATLAGLDVAAMTYVIRQGVPVRELSSEALDEGIFQAGPSNLLSTLMGYVTRLSNGGRDPSAVDA